MQLYGQCHGFGCSFYHLRAQLVAQQFSFGIFLQKAHKKVQETSALQMQHMCNQTEKPGEVLRIITYTGRAPPERGTIFQASGIWKRRDFIS